MRADNPFLMNITHDELVNYIRKNTLTILGEEIHLNAGAIHGTWDVLSPDLMGTDTQDRTVIVEAKTDFDDFTRGRISELLSLTIGDVYQNGKAVTDLLFEKSVVKGGEVSRAVRYSRRDTTPALSRCIVKPPTTC